MSDPSLLPLLQRLVSQVSAPYAKLPQTKAILSIGSVSYGIVDESSDIDIALYYDELPTDEELRQAMVRNGTSEFNWQLGSREEGGIIDSYFVGGVECQFAHTTLAAMDKDMDSILIDLDVDSPFQKALSGVLTGKTLMGGDLIESYRARARDYPDPLRKAMIERFLSFQPLWAIEDRLNSRDAELWRMQALVEGSYNLLGVLAGLNRLYYSSFQFKRMGAFVAEMTIRPKDLNVRLKRMIRGEHNAAQTFRDLVAETTVLIEKHVPEVDTSAARARLNRRVHSWTTSELEAALK